MARLPRKEKSQAEEIDQLMNYIKQGGSLGLEIEKMLEELPEKYNVLLVTSHDKYDLLIANLVKNFRKKGMPGIFVTLNKSGKDLLKLLQESKVDCNNIRIIDVVSKGMPGPKAQGSCMTYVDSPQDLTEIEAQISDCIESLPKGNRFFVLDSLSTILIYNAEKTVEKFVHLLGERLGEEHFQAVFTIMDKTRPELMNVLAQFCDKVVKPTPQIKP